MQVIGPGDRVRAEVLADAERSNVVIAALTGSCRDTVARARRQLEDSGAIPAGGRRSDRQCVAAHLLDLTSGRQRPGGRLMAHGPGPGSGACCPAGLGVSEPAR